MNAKILLLLALLALAGAAWAHGAAEEHVEEARQEPADYLPVDPWPLTLYTGAFVLLVAFVAFVFREMTTEAHKKIFFTLIAVPTLLVTLYLGVSTVYLNVVSESGGPVHWHADYEIWVCGKKVENLADAGFFSNTVGTPVLHHHEDYRIHVEGLVVNKEDIALSKFFKAIGGNLTDSSITLPLEGGMVKTYRNGDQCPDGRPGRVKLYVKDHQTGRFVESKETAGYLIKPGFEVPPGDYLKIAFEPEGD